MASSQVTEPHWLDQYGACPYYEWHHVSGCNDEYFARHLGIVESAFDHDGTDFEGRADVQNRLVCEVQFAGSYLEWREHVLKAWAALRAQHALLRASAVDANSHSVLHGTSLRGRCFLIKVPKTVKTLIDEAEASITFLGDHGYGQVDPREFERHCMNTGRRFDPAVNLCRVHVLPLEKLASGRYRVTFANVSAHQIIDGVTALAWHSHFIDLLNEENDALDCRLGRSCGTDFVRALLPPPQEALYPRVADTAALACWKWAISRVLRHVRRPPSEAFRNPLKRAQPLAVAQRMAPVFEKVLDYGILPPLNSFVESFDLPTQAYINMKRLCRESGVSLGAGGFALVALVMSQLEEQIHPLVPLDKRPAFVPGFPLDPRHVIGKGSYESLILSFSDGISLPFLPTYLPVEGRFTLLARLAHRQLAVYQKRQRSRELEAQLGSRSPSQFIESTYLASIERLEAKLPTGRKRGINVQGAYPAAVSKSGPTCGVSSLGNRSVLISGGKYTFDGTRTFAVDFRDLGGAVRARDGEFLVGSQGDDKGFGFSVSYDANAVDEAKVETWKSLICEILLPDAHARL